MPVSYSATVYQPVKTRSVATAISAVLGTVNKPTSYQAVDTNRPMTMPNVQIGGKSAYDYSKEAVRNEAARNQQLRNEALQTRIKSLGLSGAALGKIQQQGAMENDIAAQRDIAGINQQQISDVYNWSKDKANLDIQQEMNRVNTELQNRGYSNQERQAYISALVNDINQQNQLVIQQGQFGSSQQFQLDLEKIKSGQAEDTALRNLQVESAYNKGAAGTPLPANATEYEKFAYEKGKAGAAYDDVQRQLKTEDEIKKAKVTAIANAYQQGVDPLGMAEVFDEILGIANIKTTGTQNTGTSQQGTQPTGSTTVGTGNTSMYSNGLASPYPTARKAAVVTSDVISDAANIVDRAKAGDGTAQSQVNAMVSKAYTWSPQMSYDSRGFWRPDQRYIKNPPKRGDVIIYQGKPYAVINDSSMKTKGREDTDSFNVVDLETGKISEAYIEGNSSYRNLRFSLDSSPKKDVKSTNAVIFSKDKVKTN